MASDYWICKVGSRAEYYDKTPFMRSKKIAYKPIKGIAQKMSFIKSTQIIFILMTCISCGTPKEVIKHDSFGTLGANKPVPFGDILTYPGNIKIGVGFAGINGETVITADHVVARSDTFIFAPQGSAFLYKISKTWEDSLIDIALLKRTAGKFETFFSLGDFDKVKIRDSVVFITSINSQIRYGTNVVFSKGQTLTQKGGIVDFLEIFGIAQLGISGSPICLKDSAFPVIGIACEIMEHEKDGMDARNRLIRVFSLKTILNLAGSPAATASTKDK